jgi:dTDP-4-amino-4,6-dideoxygalactose transaminase
MEGSAERDSFEWIGRPRGDIACFSFHPRKILTTGDGGMLTTRDPDLDRRFRRERQHGMDIPDTTRHGAPRVLNERHVTLGYNYRMTDVQAAIGRVQLERLPEMLERRRSLAARYHALLEGTPIEAPRVPEWARPNWQSYWVRLPDDCDRQSLMQRMLDAGIATRRGIMCSHQEPVYSVEPWKAGPGGLSRSERAQERTLLLPIFHTMTERDQDRVMESLLAGVAATGTRGAS